MEKRVSNEEIFNETKGIVQAVYHKYFKNVTTLSEEDLIAYGNLGLWKGILSYDDSKEVKIVTHLYNRVYYAMRVAIRDNGNSMGSKRNRAKMYHENVAPFSYYTKDEVGEEVEGEDFVNGVLYQQREIEQDRTSSRYFRKELAEIIRRLAPIKNKVLTLR
jgi:DNA-directed RNA polymerase specialized sigma subunit